MRTEMEVEGAFRRTCHVLLKQEVGSLAEFEKFLCRYSQPLHEAKSALSKKPVFYSAPYKKSGRFVSFDEYEMVSQFSKPLGINSIKDVDSLREAVRERAYYCGNKVLGNSRNVTESENCVDAFNVHQCYEITKGEYLAYTNLLRESKYMFGCSSVGESSFCINTTETVRATRCFESAIVINSSDLYLSYNCKNVHEGFFCFNQHSKRFAIGNTALGMEKYKKMKEHLLSQIVDEMKSKKSFPSLVELIEKGKAK